MIVVEGMDGSGKTNLVNRIAEEFGIPIHERAATSEGGPRLDLFDWAMRDVDTMSDQEFSVYDRHPLISEFIYGPIVRRNLDERFLGCDGHSILKKFRYNCLVIFCDPGMNELSKNIAATVHMPGVSENAAQLIWAYRAWYANYLGEGMITRWNYTRPTWHTLHLRIRAHITDWFGISDDH